MVGRKYWKWLRYSPVVVLAVLVCLGAILPSETSEELTAYIWFAVAIGSLIFAHRVMKRARILMIVAREDYPEGHPLRDETEFDFSLAIMVVWLHIMFASVGAAAAFLPDSWESWRIAIGRDLLLLGQYILFLVVARQYLTQKRLDERLLHGGGYENGHCLDE